MCERILKALFVVSLALMTATPISGCGRYWVSPYITVDDSALNWMVIHYYTLGGKSPRRISVEIRGTGMVEVRKGRSELVSNDFAKRHSDKSWGDIKTARFHIDPKHVKDIFQHLVNCGVLDRDKNGKSSGKDKFDRFIAVRANISNYTYSENENIFDVDPDLAEELLDVVREFENPAL